MRDPNFIPDNMDKELEIRCDAGNRMFDDLWTVIIRHMVESNMTHWEISGCLDTAKQLFIDKYCRPQPIIQTDDENLSS